MINKYILSKWQTLWDADTFNKLYVSNLPLEITLQWLDGWLVGWFWV